MSKTVEDSFDKIMKGLCLTPPLKEIARKFIANNRFPKPEFQRKIGESYFILWDKQNYALLSEEPVGSMLDSPRPNFGGSGLSNSHGSKYTLEGKLGGKRVQLEAEVIITDSYRRETTKMPGGLSHTSLKPEDPRKYISREDSKPYWFVTPAEKKSK